MFHKLSDDVDQCRARYASEFRLRADVLFPLHAVDERARMGCPWLSSLCDKRLWFNSARTRHPQEQDNGVGRRS